MSIIIFVIVYGRMIEIYCMVSLAPIPMATWGNHEQSHMGQNYLKRLFAHWAFRAFSSSSAWRFTLC